MPKKRGKLILIEGGEGSGKGVNVAHIKEHFKDREDIVFTREPGGTPLAEVIRSVILKPDHKAITPLTELLLFYAARVQHIHELVNPALSRGQNVICDRADPSTIAYQIYGRDRKDLLDEALHLSAVAWGASVQDLVGGKEIFDAVIYLDVPPKVGLARVVKSRESTDRIEKEALSFHERVHKGYDELIHQNLFGPWHRVDATRPLEEVKFDVLKKVLEVVG